MKLFKSKFVKNIKIARNELTVLMRTAVFQRLKVNSAVTLMQDGDRTFYGNSLGDFLAVKLRVKFQVQDEQGEQVCIDSIDSSRALNDINFMIEKYFNFQNVYQTLERVNRRAASGPDLINVRFYLRFANIIVPYLVKLFIYWSSNIMKRRMKIGVFLVCFNKDSGEDVMSNNGQRATVLPTFDRIRPIAIEDVDAKIFGKVLNQALLVECEGIIYKNQFCLRGRNIGVAIGLFKEAHLVAKNNGDSKLLVALLDMQEAFDRVKLSFVMSLLRKVVKNVALVCALENYLYARVASVKIGYTTFGEFRILNGISQGSPLSSTIFAIYINPLLVSLHGYLKGVFVPLLGEYLKIISYADDLVFYAQSADEFNGAIEIINEYKQSAGLTLNMRKSVVFHLKTMSPSVLLPDVGKK